MEFALLKSFDNYIDAHLVLTRLKDEGVTCWLKNENITTLMPIWGAAVGGIQLMVNKAEQQKASYILKVMEEERSRQTVCPSCGSGHVQYIPTASKSPKRSNAAVAFFLGNRAAAPEGIYHCFDCGHEWN